MAAALRLARFTPERAQRALPVKDLRVVMDLIGMEPTRVRVEAVGPAQSVEMPVERTFVQALGAMESFQ